MREGMSEEESAHAVVEAGKSNSLTSAGWRPRNASGLVQLESSGLRTREPVTNSRPRARGDEMRWSTSSREAEKKGQIPPPPLLS